jgi:osmotically-inducible protein OsmY
MSNRYNDRDYTSRSDRGYRRGYERDDRDYGYGSERNREWGGRDYDEYQADYGSGYERDISGYSGTRVGGTFGAGGEYGPPAGRRRSAAAYRGGGTWGYAGSGYRGPFSGYESGGEYRERDRGGADERTWWDRTSDEVASWFGDEDAERRRRMDEMRARRGMAGRGPKGYTRSDERIREDVSDRLSDDDFVDASDVEVSVERGVVTLSGRVQSRHEKRRTVDIAEAVSGVTDVLNLIRVGRDTTETTATQHTASTTARASRS